MPDPKPNEGGNPGDQKDLISKAEVDKTLATKDNEIASLKRSVEDQQMKLLDQDYLDFVDAKRKGKSDPKADELKAKGVPEELVQTVRQLEHTVRSQQNVLANMAAYIELEETRKSFKDFDDFRDDVDKIIEAAQGQLTFKQAYLIAKGQKVKEDKADDKKADDKPKSKGSEKPGSGVIPESDDMKKEFKTKHEADLHTDKVIKEKYGLEGDTI
jgi:hypothetical protein